MACYMNYNDFTGPVTLQGCEGMIELASVSWSIGRSISHPVGQTADPTASVATISDIMITKENDCTSTKLVTEALQGGGVPVKIVWTTTGAKPAPYLELNLTNGMISQFTQSSSGGDQRPSESYSISFTKFEFKSIPLGPDNTPGTPDAVTFDLSTGTVV